ncbi:MAG: hypothetical protein SRB1_00818 [Desulfobacteraceae bacterium Eth-SRB1]|nr:MAG: hypothetical protein SRB1_00818 [Desulfobacteraceae bacterium Eth-SRB1]
MEFSGWSARHVAERIWSPDQKIVKKADGKIRLIFSSSSEYELTGWVLSFADEARVVKPKWLVEEIKKTLGRMQEVYTRSRSCPKMSVTKMLSREEKEKV